MRKQLRKNMQPIVRGYIRSRVREGETSVQIAEGIESKYNQMTTGVIRSMIKQEERRHQSMIDILARDKRRRVDWSKITGCGNPDVPIRAYISLYWTDERTGRNMHTGHVVTLNRNGSLGSIINSALNEVISHWSGKNYEIPTIRSTNTTGNNRYRVEYVECV